MLSETNISEILLNVFPVHSIMAILYTGNTFKRLELPYVNMFIVIFYCDNKKSSSSSYRCNFCFLHTSKRVMEEQQQA